MPSLFLGGESKRVLNTKKHCEGDKMEKQNILVEDDWYEDTYDSGIIHDVAAAILDDEGAPIDDLMDIGSFAG